MTTQEETIVWHKYPEEKPKGRPADNDYLVCVNNNHTQYADLYNVHDGFIWCDTEDSHRIGNVTAWAEMPRGWRE